jgi:hypothetical protein
MRPGAFGTPPPAAPMPQPYPGAPGSMSPNRPMGPVPGGVGMPPRPYVASQPKGGAGKIVLIIIVILLVLGAVAGAVYFFFLRAPSTTNTANTVVNAPNNAINNLLNNTSNNATNNSFGNFTTNNSVNTTPPVDTTDLDTDGLTAAVETACGTDEADADSDNDTYDDGTEVANGFDPTTPTPQRLDPAGTCVTTYQASLTDSTTPSSTSPANTTTTSNSTGDSSTFGGSTSDPDNDRLTNDQEAVFGTDPINPDSDGDGVKDGDEVLAGTDPNGPGQL